MPEARALERARSALRRAAYRARCSLDVGVVVERGRHRDLLGAGQHEAEVLADREQLAHHRRIAGDERGAVAGQVRPLGQGVHGEDPGRGRRRRRPDAARETGSALPAALQVALVGDQQGAALTAPGDHLARWSTAGRGRWGSTASSARPAPARSGPSASQRVGGTGSRTGQAGADLVGRVGQRRVHDEVAGAERRGGSAARRSAPWSRSTGSTASGVSPQTPNRRASQPTHACAQRRAARR